MQALVPYDVTDATLVSSSAPETDYAAWVSGSTYNVGTRAIRTTGVHKVFERLLAGAGTVPPEDDAVNWVEVSSTNAWAMFDSDPTSRTIVASPLTVQITASGTWSDVVLLGVTGSTVTVSASGVSKSVSVPAEVIVGQGSTVVIGGMAGSAGTVTVSITGSGSVACAALAVGTWTYCGDTMVGSTLGGVDNCRIEWDKGGNATVQWGNKRRKLVTPINAPVAQRDQLARVLTALRARPIFWRGLPWLDSTIVWGSASASLSYRAGLPVVTGSVSVTSLAFGL